MCVAGLIAIPIAFRDRADSIFFEQFARFEWLPLAVTALFALVTWRERGGDREGDDAPFSLAYHPWLLGALAAVVVYAGIRFVFHGYLFTDDEYSAWFQAQIFATGKSSAHVSAAWCPYIGAITPTSIVAANCTWRLGFLPLHSAYNAVFIALGVDRAGGPIATMLSVVLVGSIARKLWPDKPNRAALATLLFASSAQMLYMAMTMFSMSTHLLLTLVWLRLYVHKERWSDYALPWVTALAIGVHSPYPHGYFVIPFALRFLWDRRFAQFAYFAIVSWLALRFWQGYFNNSFIGSSHLLAPGGQTAAVAKSLVSGIFAVRGMGMPTGAMHMALVATWNTPLLSIAGACAMLSWRRLDSFSRDATLAILLVVAIRALTVWATQGAGWGYRYFQDCLGVFALLGTAGCDLLWENFGGRRLRTLLACSLVISGCTFLWRGFEVHKIIEPYRHASEWFSSRRAKVVIYSWSQIPYGRQLLRNDPFLRTSPVVMACDDVNSGDCLRAQRLPNVLVVTPESISANHLPERETHPPLYDLSKPLPHRNDR